MFFMMGITSGRKDLDYHQMVVCSRCGRYSNYSVFMTYTVLSLFFIPVFRWNRKYYVTTGCCRTTWQLDPEVGRAIARGEQVKITPQDLSPIYGAGWQSQGYGSSYNSYENKYDDSDNKGYGADGYNRNDQDYVEVKEAVIDVEAREEDDQDNKAVKTCPYCGFKTHDEEYVFCPKCGKKY